MIRFVLAILFPAAAAIAAPVPAAPPPIAPAPAPPATRPSPHEFHVQAYEFMRVGKWERASPLLARAYNDTPPAQRTRALVLNRAIMDLAQRQNLLRGIQDL